MRRALVLAVVLCVGVAGLAAPLGGQTADDSSAPPEPPAKTHVGLAAGLVEDSGAGGAAGSEQFVPVPAVPGTPPADGPLDDGAAGVGGSGAGGSSDGDGDSSDPAPDPPAMPVAEDSGSREPVSVEGESGPAPEGYEGLAPCGDGHVCGKANILPPPTGLACSVTATSIVFSWNAVTGADDYTAKIQLDTPGSTQTSMTTSSTSVTFTELTSSTRYYVSVHSNVGGVAQYFSGIYCTTAVGPPTCGIVSATTVRLDWRADSGVHNWYAARATTGGNYVDGRSISGSTLTTTFTGLSENVSYTFYFWWQASQTGPWNQVLPSTSCTTEAPPSAPSVTCTTTASTITVRWRTVTGADEYRVSKGAGWATVSGLSHEFTDLTPSTTYTVSVQGGNGAGWGTSGTASCTTKAPLLPAPTGLSCSATPTAISFSWNTVAGADSYSAMIRLAEPGSSQSQLSTTATSVTFTSLSPFTTYWVSVLAVKDGDPQHFAGVNCTTLADIAAPVLSCRATPTTILVFWDKIDGAARYRAKLGSGDWITNLTTTWHTFSELSPGTSYGVSVQSGAEEVGKWGQVGTATCVTAASGLTCGAATISSVALNWAPRSSVRYWYAARAVPGGYTDGRTLDGTVTTTFTGLAKGTSYVLRLWWWDGTNWNEVTPSPVCSTTLVAAPEITDHRTGGTTLTVEWAPVEGAEVYQAKYQPSQPQGASGSSGSSRAGQWVVVVSTGTFHTFTGLTPGTEYMVEIRAGTSSSLHQCPRGFDFSVEFPWCWSGQIPNLQTTAPAECTTSTLNSVAISWKDPQDQFNWRVRRITGDNQFADTQTFAKGGATSASYTGLQAGRDYEFEVSKRAGNTGEWNDHTPSLYCSTLPGNPNITQCPQTADTDGTIRWTPNGAVAYRIASNGLAANPNWTVTDASSYTFTGLAEGTTYNVIVQAWNASGWSADSTCPTQLQTLPAIPGEALTTPTPNQPNPYYFNKGVIKGVLYSAGKAIAKKKSCTAGMPSTNKLAAIMLSIPIHELRAASTRSSSPSPMILSRWEHLNNQLQTDGEDTKSLNTRAYSHVTKEDYVRAYWSPGVGLWQLDNWDNSLPLNHAERADTTNGGLVVASHLLNNYCTGLNTLKAELNGRWNGCKRDNVPDRCYNTFVNFLFDSTEDALNATPINSSDEADGGVQERTCRWTTISTELACYLYDVESTQGWMDKQDPTDTDGDGGRTPLSKAFLSFTDPNTHPNADRDTGTRYAVWPKQWPRSTSLMNWPTDVVASDKTIFRAVKQDVEIRCSPGRDPTPENVRDCAEDTYKPFGDKIENHDFSGSNKFAEGWYDDSVPFRNGGTAADRHTLQVQNCEAGVIFEQAVVYCWWVDV